MLICLEWEFDDESSTFAVVRTTATGFQSGTMAISGIDTAIVSTYVPIPEPGISPLLAAAGLACLARRRRRTL